MSAEDLKVDPATHIPFWSVKTTLSACQSLYAKRLRTTALNQTYLLSILRDEFDIFPFSTLLLLGLLLFSLHKDTNVYVNESNIICKWVCGSAAQVAL